jgi:type I restriction enzyme M protein
MDTMFEQTCKNIDDALWKESGCTTELDYTEQTSWLLFLKYLDSLDHNKAMTGDDLVQFVDTALFPYLHGIKQRASGPHTIEYKISEIFGEIKNKIRSGYTLRDIIDQVDKLRFRSQTEKHELSVL